MSAPCTFCGVNAWTACKHRPAVERGAPPPDRERAGPKISGGGLYRVAKRYGRHEK